MASNGISAVQIGDNRVEYLQVDLAAAYGALAPCVVEALATLKHGNVDQATKSLQRAMEVIDATAMRYTMVCSIFEDIDEVNSP